MALPKVYLDQQAATECQRLCQEFFEQGTALGWEVNFVEYVLLARHHSFGARQVVVQELAVWKTAADLAKEDEQFAIAQRALTGK